MICIGNTDRSRRATPCLIALLCAGQLWSSPQGKTGAPLPISHLRKISWRAPTFHPGDFQGSLWNASQALRPEEVNLNLRLVPATPPEAPAQELPALPRNFPSAGFRF